MRQLVTSEWLEANLDKVKILDATWFLPNSNKNAEEEFKKNHIKNSIFFNIDKNSKQNSHLPHMLPSISEWEDIISNLGNTLIKGAFRVSSKIISATKDIKNIIK